jgi:glycosyltransferase involved in cell wall biosynthesis
MSVDTPKYLCSTTGMSEDNPTNRPKRIFVDATSWLSQQGRPTGIPRVIEEIVRRSQGKSAHGTPLGRLFFRRGRWRELTRATEPMTRILRTSMSRADELQLQAAASAQAGQRFRSFWLRAARGWHRLRASLAGRAGGGPCPPLGPGDVILSLDMQSACTQGLAEAVARGVKVVSLVYDCLPLTHPEFFPLPGMRESYVSWHAWAGRHASGMVAISRTSMRESIRLQTTTQCWHAWFHLGGDIPTPAGPLRSELSVLVGRPTFLMVGTVEPRKNHALAVAAMEIAWSKGCQASLVIIGGKGWNNQALLVRISSLRAAGRPIIVVHDASDGELAGVYEAARALIAASVAEGYGLPLAEAAARGLPVLASDIPVFREIAPAGTSFFPLADAEALARQIERVAAAPLRRSGQDQPISWDESMRRLVAIIENDGRTLD